MKFTNVAVQSELVYVNSINYTHPLNIKIHTTSLDFTGYHQCFFLLFFFHRRKFLQFLQFAEIPPTKVCQNQHLITDMLLQPVHMISTLLVMAVLRYVYEACFVLPKPDVPLGCCLPLIGRTECDNNSLPNFGIMGVASYQQDRMCQQQSTNPFCRCMWQPQGLCS